MWSAILVVVVSLGVAVGIFLSAWVVYGLTIALGIVLLIIYVVNLSVRSLFGESDKTTVKLAETTQFKIFAITSTFYLSMWLAYFLK
jgi:hypothetical protein